MKQYCKAILCVICVLTFYTCARSQSTYRTVDSNDVDMKLSGTSTLHAWTMVTKLFDGEAKFGLLPGSKLNALHALTFSLLVKNLKSDEKTLDKNAYKALKADQYNTVLYSLTSATVMPKKDGKHLIKTKGNLTVAGVTKNVAMDVSCLVNHDATITCTGSEKLKMTDYNIKPPSFMLGAMKTGNDITLDFTLVFKETSKHAL